MPVTVRTSVVRLIAGAAIAVAAIGFSAATTGAAPKQGKTYSMVVESPEWAGVTDGSYTVTITNTTGTQQLGSANLTIPTARQGDIDFTVTSEPVFVGSTALGATILPREGKLIKLRNLALPPAPAQGSSVTIALGLRMPCDDGPYPWGVDARQSNDFSGTPGNALGPVSGTLATTVQGSCKLRFDPGQPTSAEVDDEITADAFQPGSADPVAVEAVDGSPAPQRLTWFADTVELTATGGPGSLSASSPASAGLATFDNLLSIALSGNYNLTASPANAIGFSNGESADFQIIDDVGACSSSSCHAQVDGAKSGTSLTGSNVAGNGFALVSLNLGTEPVCAGYAPPTQEWFEFQIFGAIGDKTVEAFYNKAAMKNVAGPSSLEICFAAPQDFPAKLGTVGFDYDGDAANGAEGFVGLLPNCPQTPLTPCVLSKNGTSSGGAIVTFFVPAGWGDPRYR
jgi:hypothetical protein